MFYKNIILAEEQNSYKSLQYLTFKQDYNI